MTNGPLQGQIAIPGQVVFSKIGIEGIPIFNVENGCASGSSAVHLAVQSLRAGATDVALALGAEKMNIPDKAEGLRHLRGAAGTSRAPRRTIATLVQDGRGRRAPPGSESDKPYSKFMAIYAAMCRWHMKTYGTTQRQIAAVCGQEPRPLGAQPLLAVPQAVHHRGDPCRAADHLPAHAADVRAAVRRRRRRDPVHRGRPQAHRRRPQRAASGSRPA